MRVLHAIHDFLPRHAAGSELYAAALARAQQGLGLHPHVLAAEYDPARAHASLAWRLEQGLPVTEVVNNWDFADFAESWRSPRLGASLAAVLDAVEPQVLHVHSLLNLSFELPELARRRGIPVVATVHDFTLLCPSGGQRVHVAESWLCHAIDVERCARCFRESPFHAQMAWARATRGALGSGAARGAAALLRGSPRLLGLARGVAAHAPLSGPLPADLSARLDAARTVLGTLDHVVAPSRAVGDELLRFGLPAERLEVRDYGFAPLPRQARPARAGRPLRFGFVGTLVWHKGAHLLLDAARRLGRDDVEIELHGGLDTFPDYVARLRHAARGLPVRFAGPFLRSDAPAVYARLDALVVPSLWPENSPLVIHEAFQAGVPVLGADIGGIPDLVGQGRAGLLFPPGSAEGLARVMSELLARPDQLDALAAGIPPVVAIEDDARCWRESYRQVTA